MNGRHARLEAVPAGTTGEKESDIPAPIVYHHQIRDGAFSQVSSLNNSQHVRLLTSLSLQQSLGDQTGKVHLLFPGCSMLGISGQREIRREGKAGRGNP